MKYSKICRALAFFLCSSTTIAHDLRVSTTIDKLPLEQISPNTYLVHAPLDGINEVNEGFIANTGFLVTDVGVIVIDPGSSVQIGRKLLDKIAEVTDKSVVAVINTHVHGDHWLGNQAIVEKFPTAVIYAHEKMIERLNSGEADQWVDIISDLTKGATQGTTVVIPNRGLKGGETLTFGSTHLNIFYKGKAHTDTTSFQMSSAAWNLSKSSASRGFWPDRQTVRPPRKWRLSSVSAAGTRILATCGVLRFAAPMP